MTYPLVKIDLRHKMLSVALNEGEIVGTDQLDDAHLVDVDADGVVVALDIMTLSDFKIDEMAQRFGFADRAPAIKAAIQRVMASSTTSGSSGQAPTQFVHGTRSIDVSASETTFPTTPVVQTVETGGQ
jgi:uncharacterized protein YuzE